MSYARINLERVGPYQEHVGELAVKLEQVLVDWLPEKLSDRRVQLCGGETEKHNGLAMWRRLHIDNVGDEKILNVAGIECHRKFDQCTKFSDLTAHLDR